MKRSVSLFLVTALMAGLGAATAFGQTWGSSIPAASEETGKKDIPSQIISSLKNKIQQIEDGFLTAIYEDDVEAMKKLLAQYPTFSLLTKKFKDKQGKEMLPICIAIEEQKQEVLKYIAQENPSLLSGVCRTLGNGGRVRALAFAIELGRAEEAAVLLENVPKVERSFFDNVHVLDLTSLKGLKPLQVIISAWLDVEPNQFKYNKGYDYGRENGHKDWMISIKPEPKEIASGANCDIFFRAAIQKNGDFIVALRDELKKRNQEPKAYYTQVVDTASSNYSKQSAVRAKEMVEKAKKSPQAVFLKKYGIPLETNVDYFSERSTYRGGAGAR